MKIVEDLGCMISRSRTPMWMSLATENQAKIQKKKTYPTTLVLVIFLGASLPSSMLFWKKDVNNRLVFLAKNLSFSEKKLGLTANNFYTHLESNASRLLRLPAFYMLPLRPGTNKLPLCVVLYRTPFFRGVQRAPELGVEKTMHLEWRLTQVKMLKSHDENAQETPGPQKDAFKRGSFRYF